ncbi:potassium channel family protein [Streptomyces pactum]|uniref:Potassium channel family protein n=1 Tax=Streptomyces pactum TaxID=68249 RepID=A0ABS0NHH9_9ACTN|nr:potassium channel family protein [Streptomyces pactum]MBH5334647.1 potassium channel family protein [Streptomyces pactum]
MRDTEAQRRWEHRTQGPLLGLAVVFAVAYAVPIVLPEAGRGVHRLCLVVEWVVWGLFAADYLVRLHLAPRRWRFVRSQPLSLLVVILPMVQPLRLLRLVSTLLLVGQRARMASQVRLTTYVVGSCAGLLMFGSLAVLEVERDAPDGNIRTLGDAVWWSFTTMTTVGYGDLAPTTGPGRLLAVGLMLSGIALLGVVTANIAAWFISRFERDDAGEHRRAAAMEALTAEVRALRAEVARLTSAHGPAVAGGPAPADGAVAGGAAGPGGAGTGAGPGRGRPADGGAAYGCGPAAGGRAGAGGGAGAGTR